VPLPLVDIDQSGFYFLRLVLAIELHLDEAESATSLRLPIAHHNGIGDRAVLLEVIDQVRLCNNYNVSILTLSYESEAANKQF